MNNEIVELFDRLIRDGSDDVWWLVVFYIISGYWVPAACFGCFLYCFYHLIKYGVDN